MTEGNNIGQAGAGREQVQPGEILQALGGRDSGWGIRKLEPLQRIGLWLALAFFAYILIASSAIFFVSFRWFQLPAFPTPPLIRATLTNISDS